MRALFFYMFILFCLSCTCEDHNVPILEEEVPFPFLVDTVIYDFENVTISFNKAIDPGSFILGESVQVDVENSEFVGEIYFENQSIRFRRCDFLCADPSCEVTISLSGNEIGGVRSTLQQVLDGDRNGRDGGDFITEQLIDACIILGPTYPCVVTPSHQSDIEYDYCPFQPNEVVVTLEFSEPMKNYTIIEGSNLLLDFLPINQGEIGLEALTWNSDTTQLSIHLYVFQCDACSVTISLHPEILGFPAIESNSGLVLDGDKDGEPGGVYTTIARINETPSYVVSPLVNAIDTSDYSLTFDAFLTLNVLFSQSMTQSSATKESVTLTYTPQFGVPADVPVSFTWNDRTLMISSENSLFNLCTFGCTYRLEINGNLMLQSPLVDQAGIQLDGVRNCEPGGVYSITFTPY